MVLRKVISRGKDWQGGLTGREEGVRLAHIERRNELSRQVMFTQQVVAANKEAVEGGFNRALTDEFVEQLDPDGVHLVVFSMIHSHKQGIKVEPHVRVEAMFKMRDSMEPQRAFLDMSLERFNALANADDLTAAS